MESLESDPFNPLSESGISPKDGLRETLDVVSTGLQGRLRASMAPSGVGKGPEGSKAGREGNILSKNQQVELIRPRAAPKIDHLNGSDPEPRKARRAAGIRREE